MSDKEIYTFPTSFAQQRLWFLHQLEPDVTVYNEQVTLLLRGKLNIDALERSLAEILSRHEMLRTTFQSLEGHPVQIVSQQVQNQLKCIEVENVAESEQRKVVAEYARQAVQHRFDLEKGPLFTMTLLRFHAESHALLLVSHHIVADGWSSSIFVQELGVLYRAYAQGQPSPLPPLSLQYADFAIWQQQWSKSPEHDRQLAYWTQQLRGISHYIELPADRPRGAIRSFKGTRAPFTLPRELLQRLKQLARANEATLFMTLLAAFKVLIYRYTGETDMLIGTPSANRTRAELEQLIGFFLNALVIRTNLAQRPSFLEVLRQVRTHTLEAYDHQDLPFEHIVQALHPERSLSQSPLYQILFVMQNTPDYSFTLPGLEVTLLERFDQTAKHDLTLFVSETEQGLFCEFEYSDIFLPETITLLAEHFQVLLKEIVLAPEQAISDFCLLTEKEQRVLAESNATERTYPAGTIHQLFERQVADSPDAPALYFNDRQISFLSLNQRANQLAHHLRSLGVKAGARVGLCLERSDESIVGLLAIMKASATFVSLDPTYPAQRLSFMIEDAGVQALITREAYCHLFSAQQIPTLSLDTDRSLIEQASTENLANQLVPASSMYLIYTSGSTGRPKGVFITHEATLNRFEWMWETYPFQDDDIGCQKTSYNFADCVWEIFGLLLKGRPVVVIPQEAVLDPESFIGYLERYNVTRIVLVPSLLRNLLEIEGLGRRIPQLRFWVTSGEFLSLELVQKLRREFPTCKLLNIYGLSEVTADAIAFDIDSSSAENQAIVPIGRPLANIQAYILDADLQPVPPGIPGEIYLAGACLGLYYHKKPDLTAERFLPNPFSRRGGERLFRTGDIARSLPDGTMIYIGRNDRQVKMRGFRVELSEIEITLKQHPGIENCIVALKAFATDQRLVAYVITRSKETLPDHELRAFLNERLPEYMVPGHFIHLDAFPLNPSGKINWAALPLPDGDRPLLQNSYLMPETAKEQQIAAIWQELLSVQGIGRDDNFFDLGGHSLLAVQVHKRLKEVFQQKLTVIDIFKYPTIRALAQFLAKDEQNGSQSSLPEQLWTKLAERQRPVQRMEEGRKDIAVIAMNARFPQASSLEQFWQNLSEGVCSVVELSDEYLRSQGLPQALLEKPNYVKWGVVMPEDPALFDAAFFGFSPREASLTDPQHRLLLEMAYEVFETAGYNTESYAGKISVYAGCSASLYLLHNLLPNQSLLEQFESPQLEYGHDKDYLTTRLSYKLNLRGTSVAVQTACSTSLVALHLACEELRAGKSDMALAGGISLSGALRPGYGYVEGGIYSPDGHCRAFDSEAKGTVVGAGAGLVLLKRLDDALADGDYIHAIIKGSATNNDGSQKVGYSAPSIQGQEAVIRDALANARVDPETISYIEMHGTATRIGDPIEFIGLSQAFRAFTQEKGFCAIGSVKTNLGHMMAAAGAGGFIKTILSLEHRQIPPSLFYTEPNPTLALSESPFYVNSKLAPWERKNGQALRAGVTALGFGGTNAHIIVEEAPERQASDASAPWQLIILSAKTGTALEKMRRNLTSYLEQNQQEELADIAYTLQVGRRSFNHRLVAMCQDRADALKVFTQQNPARVLTAECSAQPRPIFFLFPGLGAQYVLMGQELYQQYAVFRQLVDECARILQCYVSYDIRELFYPQPDQVESASQCLAQPRYIFSALFVIEYALAQFWIALGVRPQAVLGHSTGEYAAACTAGILTLEDALRLTALRGELFERLPSGRMLAVTLSVEEVQPYLSEEIELALVNGSTQCVLAGSASAIQRLEERLNQQQVRHHHVQAAMASHYAPVDLIAEELTAVVRQLRLSPPRIPCLSNLTGTWMTEKEALDPDYWARQMRHTVRFDKNLTALCQTGEGILLEVGPGRALINLLRREYPSSKHLVLSSLPKTPESGAKTTDKSSDRSCFLRALGNLWLDGYAAIEWQNLYQGEKRQHIHLPTYPFERQRYWIDAVPLSPALFPRQQQRAHKQEDRDRWFSLPSWRLAPLARDSRASALSERWLFLGAEEGAGQRFQDYCNQSISETVSVSEGQRYEQRSRRVYRLQPASRADYVRLLRALQKEERLPDRIIYSWPLAQTPVALPESAKEMQALQQDFYHLLALGQALGEVSLPHPIEILILSSGMYEIESTDCLEPQKSLLQGLSRVLSQEYPLLNCRCIDVRLPERNSPQEDQLFRVLLQECRQKHELDQVAYRGSKRWVQTVEPLFSLPEERNKKPERLRQQGVYLITGGMGEIALILAEYLARLVQARLVLVGRSPLPDKAQWQQWLETHLEEDQTSRRLRSLQALEALGAEITCHQADIADFQAMETIVQQTRQRYGSIHGIIHAAGDPGGGPIQLKTPRAVQRVFAPKVQGTYVLAQLFAQEKLDFFAITSSGSALTGGLGMVDYAAANAFLDAFAHAYSRQTGTFTVSINWGSWHELGVARKQYEQHRRITSDEPGEGILPEEGLQAFQTILHMDLPQVIVSPMDFQAAFVASKQLKSSELLDQSAVALKQRASGVPRSERALVSTAYVSPQDSLERQVATIWEEVLGIEPIGIHDSFFELGGDSLLAVSLAARLRNQFGRDIPLAILLGSHTIQRTASLLREHQTREQAWSPLVPFHTTGSMPPFYCVHPLGGNVLSYRELAQALDAEQPFYGLQARGLEAGQQPYQSIEEMAAHYVQAIEPIHPPQTPYVLGGWSFGGVVAFEMAQQLRTQGHANPLVVLMDIRSPNLQPRAFEGLSSQDLATLFVEEVAVNVGLAYRPDKQAATQQDARAYLLEHIQRVKQLYPSFPLIDEEEVLRLFHVFQAHIEDLRSYQAREYPGPILYYRASETPMAGTDETMGWQALTRSPIMVCSVPGTHTTFLQAPQVQHLAAHFTAQFRQILERERLRK